MAPNGKRLLINAGSNTAAFLATLAVSFVLAPIVLRALGDVRFGAWAFAESFIAYLTLFDMGVAAALVRFVPRALARDDHAELGRLYSASLLFFAAGSIIAAVIGVAFAYFALPRFFTDPVFADEFRGLFMTLVGSFSVTLPLSVYPAMLDGLGRFTFKSLVRTSVLLIRVPLTLAAIRTEHRLLNLGFVIAGCSVVEHLILAAGVFHWLPDLRCKPRTIDRATIKQVAAYSRDAMAAMFAGRLAFHTDAFVIAPFLGAGAITLFSFPAKLVEMGKSVLRSATTTLTATFSSLEAAGDHDRLRTTFLAGSRAAWYASLPVQAGLFVLGPTFLRLWIGPDFATQGMSTLFSLNSVLSLAIAQSVASRVLYGTGKLRAFAWATLADGIANLILSVALVGPYGIFGVALGTAIPHAIFCVSIVAHVCRSLEVSRSQYINQMVRPIVAILLPMLMWSFLAARGIQSWIELFTAGSVGIVAYTLCVLFFEQQTLRLNRQRDTRPADPLPMRRAG